MASAQRGAANVYDFSTDRELPMLDLLPIRVDVSRMLLTVSQHGDEKGEYDFDATGIRLNIPSDI